MLLGNSEFSWTWETMQSSWQLHKLISLPWEQPAFPTLLSCLLAKASSLCSLIIAAMSRRGLSFSILSLSHQQNLPLLQKATVHYFSQKWGECTLLQNVFLLVLCHLLLPKCCICVFPLNKMRLNVLEFKPVHCKDTQFCFISQFWHHHSFFHTTATCFSLERRKRWIKNAKPKSAFTPTGECAVSQVSSVSSFSHNVQCSLHATSQFPSVLPVKLLWF